MNRSPRGAPVPGLCFLFEEHVQGEVGGNMFGAAIAELGQVETGE